MNHSLKKVLSLLLALVMCLSLVNLSAFADEGDGAQNEPASCTKSEDCPAETHEEGCPKLDLVKDEGDKDNDSDPTNEGGEPEPQADGEPEPQADEVVAQVGDQGYPTLQAAITAAKPDETVTLLKEVTENVITIGKDITLDLAGNTLSSCGKDSVIKVTAGTFTLADSSASKTGTITGGNAKQGGGVYVDSGATFNMTGGSISNNTATGDSSGNLGTGVFVAKGGTFKMSGGEITESTGAASTNHHHGLAVFNAGTFEMTGGKIHNNKTDKENGNGVVYVLGSGASFTMSGNAEISNNKAPNGAVNVGNIDSDGPETFTMTGGSIRDNECLAAGAVGVYNATFEMSGTAKITNNKAQGCGGVQISSNSTFRMFGDAEISGNEALNDGGGVELIWSTMEMSGNAKITENKVTTAGDSLSCGGGVLIYGAGTASSFTMNGGTISGNSSAKDGGGVVVMGDKASFIRNSGVLCNNTADNAGADVYADNGASVTLGNISDEGWELTSGCGHDILGWFEDSAASRWDCTNNITAENTTYGEQTAPEAGLALKAAHGRVFTVTYDANSGSNAPASDSGKVIGSTATVTVSDQQPTRSGYTFTGWNTAADGSGTAYSANDSITLDGDITLFAQWSLNYVPPIVTTYTLTINYVDENGNTVAPSVTRSVVSGDSYSVTSPVIEGYTPDQAVVSGTLTSSLTVTVTYTANPVEPDQPTEHTVTVTPVDEDGNRLGDDVVVTVSDGEDYTVPVPEIEGYTPELTEVTGTMDGEDVVVIVTYTANDPSEEDIGEENPPLVENPDIEDPGEEDIGEEDTPLVENPGGEEAETDVPQTGDFSAIWFAALILSACGLIVLNKKRRVTEG